MFTNLSLYLFNFLEFADLGIHTAVCEAGHPIIQIVVDTSKIAIVHDLEENSTYLILEVGYPEFHQIAMKIRELREMGLSYSIQLLDFETQKVKTFHPENHRFFWLPVDARVILKIYF